ncbi:hypothetical protein CcaCcLH18_08874 [Colletotrichum camelliae]|nr:hypothetical protein CcaCcLH18_08874 [Colletotrichum camelliae]
MRTKLFSGRETQQPSTATDNEEPFNTTADEEYVIVALPDMSSTEDAHHHQSSAVANQELSGIQQSSANDDQPEKGQHDEMASSSYREGPKQRLLTVASSDCVARAHRSALSRDAKDLSNAIENQKTPGFGDLVSSRKQSKQRARAGATTTTNTTPTRRLRFLEAPGTFLLAHFVSFLLLTFPSMITNLDITYKDPATWQLCLYVLTYAILVVVKEKWMVYMSPVKKADTTEQKGPGDTTATAGSRDFGTAVAAKAARVALVCAVGEFAGMTRTVLFAMENFDLTDDLRTKVKSG